MPYRVLTEYLIMSVGVVVVCLCAVPWVHNVTLAHASQLLLPKLLVVTNYCVRSIVKYSDTFYAR